MRTVLAILAGWGIFALSAAVLFGVSRQDPHAQPSPGFALFGVLWGIAFAAIAGYVAARIARHPLLASLVVGVLIAIGALVSLIARPGAGAVWTQVSAILLMAPAAAVAGRYSGPRSK